MAELQSDVYIGLFAETPSPTLAQYVVTQVKDKLIEDWKAGRGLMANVQQFMKDPDLSEHGKC